MLFLSIETLRKCHILKLRYVIAQLERIILLKCFFFTFVKTLLIQKIKRQCLFKFFLQHKEQESDENIFNSQL
jgi:hypothetical protein